MISVHCFMFEVVDHSTSIFRNSSLCYDAKIASRNPKKNYLALYCIVSKNGESTKKKPLAKRCREICMLCTAAKHWYLIGLSGRHLEVSLAEVAKIFTKKYIWSVFLLLRLWVRRNFDSHLCLKFDEKKLEKREGGPLVCVQLSIG